MKTLLIVRHGKSAWDNPELKDHDRTLLPKGIARTKKVGNYLADKKNKPDLIVTSSAIRALETSKILAAKLNYPIEQIRIESDIYHQGSKYLMELLYGLPNDVNSVMLVGHNPTFTHFANKFLDEPIDALPTTGAVSISFATEKWEEINIATKNTNFVVAPRML
jgi:phosphohistidine phosphatase